MLALFSQMWKLRLSKTEETTQHCWESNLVCVPATFCNTHLLSVGHNWDDAPNLKLGWQTYKCPVHRSWWLEQSHAEGLMQGALQGTVEPRVGRENGLPACKSHFLGTELMCATGFQAYRQSWVYRHLECPLFPVSL